MKVSQMVRMGLSAARVSFAGARIPINVMLSVTNRCNSHCAYCDIPLRDQPELSDADIHGLIDEMADAGTRRLGIWGGEPLLRKGIGDFITHAHERGMYTTMDTNGYLLPRRIHELRHLDHILISIDGREAHHDANREPGSFRKSMRALEVAIDHGLNAWTITVLTRHNLDSIDFILDEAERLGFMASFQVLHHSPEMSKTGMSLRPSNRAYRQAIRKLIAAKAQGRRVGSSAHYLYHVLTWPDFAQPRSSVPHRGLNCLAGQAFCNVDTDGTVYPCSLLIGSYPGVHYKEAGFRHAFDGCAEVACKACVAACFTEYSKLFALNIRTIAEWSLAMLDSGGSRDSILGQVSRRMLPVVNGTAL